MRFRHLTLIILALLPVVANASGVFSVPPTDKSMQYLASIFGSVGSLPIQVSGEEQAVSTIFQTLVDRFNIIVFTLGLIIIAWTAMVSTISTAQEGEVMGKKFSSIWIPARMGFGMYFLLPAGGAGGYSLIQTAIMWMIVQGVGAANAIWKEIVLSPSPLEDTRQATLKNRKTTVEGLFKSALCMEYINNSPALLSNVGNEPITMFREGDKINVGLISKSGESPSNAKASLCGSFRIPDSGDVLGGDNFSDSEREARKDILADGIEQAFFTLSPAASEALLFPPDQWVNANVLVTAARTLDNAASQLSVPVDLESEQETAILQGWIHAGSYYFKIVGGMGVASGQVDSFNISPTQYNSAELEATYGTDAIPTNIGTVEGTYINQAVESVAGTDTSDDKLQTMGFNSAYNGGSAQSVINAIFGDLFTDLAIELGENMTSDKGDPVVSMSRFGTSVVNVVEITFFGGILIAFLLWMVSSIMHSVQPMGPTMDAVLGIVMSVAGLIISLLWMGAITLALYIPMIPYLVFTFSAITWIILVIEALLAAPLVGLTLVMPSEDELGKAGNGIVILLGLFLRPPLMILGFLFSVKLLMVAFAMLNYGFASTIESSLRLGSIGLFGPVAIFTLYVGLAIAIVHECFSLIYKLPDQALRWIGSSSGGGDEMSKVKGMQGSIDKGAGIGKGAMSGIHKHVGDKAKVG